MRYKKRYYTNDDWKEITYEEAMRTVLGTFKDNAMTRSMLTIGNLIQCQLSEIRVYDDNGLTAMAGLVNLVPDEYWDEEESRNIAK